ncbi:MAG TPA: MFS transporter [Steroidobacteraceae bacterium]|jgi:AAHS family 4-hydroxybenzoate transporter-like MFS transporter|nr:MFS transporter [Steroidobacteraceae bacterium]
MAGRTVDISALIDGRRLGPFNYKLIVLSWLITVFDGFDMMMISFTAPYMRDQLKLDQLMLGNLFSAGLLGMLLGGFFFSWLGDQIGRRPTVLLTSFLFGLLTIATGFAGSYEGLLALRFLDGLAIGGMLPLAWALNIEFVPSRMRSTVVTVIMLGYSIGTSIAGPMTVLLAPRFGWPAVFFAGGGGSLLAAGLLCWGLPESVRFLVSRGRDPARIAGILKRVMPEAGVDAEDRFILSNEVVTREPFKPRQLFEGRLLKLTPLLWVGYIASTLAVYFGANWGPIVLESMSFTRDTAAYVASIASALGALFGLLLMRFTDRKGALAVAVYPLLAVPVLVFVGLVRLSPSVFLPLQVLGSVLVAGGHFGILSIASIYYPTAIRASGGGWATSVAKVGGIAGPILGGVVLAAGLPAVRTYALFAVCPVILGVCAIGIARVVRRTAAPAAAQALPAADLIPRES